MQIKEEFITVIEIEKNKKPYVSPTLVAIGEVKDTTRGAGGDVTDGAGLQFGTPPVGPS